MAPPTHPVFPPPPPAAEKKEKEPAAALLYELRFKQVRLLQQALRSLVLTASFESLIPGRGRITGSGDFYISADDLNLVARTLLPPDVDTCLALRQFATFVVPADLVLRFELRRLEEIMERSIVGDGRGLTLILKGENTAEMVYLLKDENGNEVHNSVIPVTSTHVGADPMGSYWSGLVKRFGIVLSIQIPPIDTLHLLIGFDGSPVRITVDKDAVVLRVGKNIVKLTERFGLFKIWRCTRDLPLEMAFLYLHPEDAILKAATLSPYVFFHLTSDSRCVLEIFVSGVGSIFFCFKPI